MSVKLDGFENFEAALAQLPKAMGRTVLRKVARGALEPMAEDARARAPQDEGNLSERIEVSERRTRRAKRVGGKFDRRYGLQMVMGPASGQGVLYYAAHVEFGTVDTAPQPYMRPAWDAGGRPALEYIKGNLWAELDRAAARFAKRQLKLKA